ncbi:MAG TPA: hypothetical protein DD632_03160 [Oribacterium sp.]|nr:hypothetical protein [Oribacterium sp.]
MLHFDRAGVMEKNAHPQPERALADRNLTDEDTGSYDAETAVAEAKRCMNCGCYSVNASDLSPVMVMLGATLKTSEGREIKAEDFFCTQLKAYANLNPGELITEVEIPERPGFITGYEKLRLRPSIDFAITSLAWGYKLDGDTIQDVRLVLGAVAPMPRRLPKVEEFLKGKKPDEKVAEEAAELAVEGAAGIGHNEFKIDEIKTHIKRFVMNIK